LTTRAPNLRSAPRPARALTAIVREALDSERLQTAHSLGRIEREVGMTSRSHLAEDVWRLDVDRIKAPGLSAAVGSVFSLKSDGRLLAPPGGHHRSPAAVRRSDCVQSLALGC